MNMSDWDTRPAAEKTALVTRGVCRLLAEMDCASVTELTLKTGRRVDVIALDPKGQVTIVEVKVSVEDFRADTKWTEYLPFCDRFFFAVPTAFPDDMLPPETGLITADPYGAGIVRPAAEGTMNAARRKALTLRFARHAATRLGTLVDTARAAPGRREISPL